MSGMDDYTQVAAHNDYPIELWRDEALREPVWALLRDACAQVAADAGRKLASGPLHREERHSEFARDIRTDDGTFLVPCSEDEADAVRLRLACWTAPQ